MTEKLVRLATLLDERARRHRGDRDLRTDHGCRNDNGSYASPQLQVRDSRSVGGIHAVGGSSDSLHRRGRWVNFR